MTATIQYTPAPTVKDFIKHYTPGKLFTDWIVGPVGSGKTTGIFMKLAYMAGLQTPSPIDGVRRSRCVIVRSTMPQLKDTTIKSFDYWFKDGVAGKWNATDKNFTLRFADVECEVIFRPLDTPDDVNRVLSLEVTFAIIDEFVQIPQEIVEALTARCGRYPPEIHGGATNWGMWGASNPGMESDWWYPMLEDHSELPEGQAVPDNWTYFKQPSGFSPLAENVEKLPGKSFYYTDQAKGKSKHWVKQFIEVQWGYSMNGKPVFPMFDPDIHVSKTPIKPDPYLPLVIGYDPGVNSALVLMQYSEWGQLRVLQEIVLTNYMTDRMIADKLKPTLNARYRGYRLVVAPDPASANRAQASNNSVMKELRKHFEVKADSDNSINSRLTPAQYYMMRLTGEGPALLIDPSCIKLIRALVGGYKYTVLKGDNQREVPDKNGHSHVADAFTYGVRYVKKGEDHAARTRDKPVAMARQSVNIYNMS